MHQVVIGIFFLPSTSGHSCQDQKKTFKICVFFNRFYFLFKIKFDILLIFFKSHCYIESCGSYDWQKR